MLPLSPREKRALALWLPILAGLGVLDYAERMNGTFSECHRAVRRRLKPHQRLALWTGFGAWFWHHVEKD